MYIYIYMCVCVCARARARVYSAIRRTSSDKKGGSRRPYLSIYIYRYRTIERRIC